MRGALGLVGALISVSAMSLGGAALANGGGGGGGGGMTPSMSAPRYDPAEEYRKGVEALRAGRHAEAKKAFDKVLAAAPRDANSNYLAGLARAGLNDWKGAKRFFEKAVKLDPNMVAARKELGVALARTGDTPRAQAQLDDLKQRSAACGTCAQAADLRAAVAAVSAAIGQPTARIDTRPSLMFASAETGDRAYLDAVSLINAGRYEAAIESLREAERSFGPHPDILTYLGFANRKLRRFDVAEDYYRRALAAAPGHRGATEYYGELMVERGDLEGARQKLTELEAGCAFGCVEAEELRGWIAAGGSPAS